MSEMIERAKAALRQPMNFPMRGVQEAAGALMTPPAGITELMGLSDLGREAAVRIVIAELREPTEAMVEAGGGACIDYSPREEPLPNAKAGWQAMIDAALA